MNRFTFYFFGSFLALLAWQILLVTPVQAAPTKEDYSLKPRIGFKKNYFSLEINRNLPVSETADQYSVGPHQLGLGYKHVFKDIWLMGWGLEFRTLSIKQRLHSNVPSPKSSSSQVAFLTLSHDLYYIQQLSHPLYGLVGGRIHLMYPTQKGGYPIQRMPQLSSETGAGLSAMLLYARHDELHYYLRVERWRGLASMKFHGFEFACGISWGI